MNLLAVYKNERLPSSRIRIVQMLPHLDALGLVCEAVPYPKDPLSLRSLLRRAADFDLVWLQKVLPGAMESLLWRRLATPIVFDYDDAIMFHMRPRRGSYEAPRRARRFRRIASLAEGVTCGNAYLGGLLPPGDRPVLIYPSPVPTGLPRHDYAAASGPLHVGWIGHEDNLQSLAMIAPALTAVAAKHDFELVIVSGRSVSVPGVAAVHRPWSLREQDGAPAEFDVGLMPLDGRSPYNRGKCSYKILQYMAAGIVPVATAVGMNADVIEDGRNGRLVESMDQWPRVLDDVLSMRREEMAAMALAGPAFVKARFSYEAHADALAGFFVQVLAAAARRRA